MIGILPRPWTVSPQPKGLDPSLARLARFLKIGGHQGVACRTEGGCDSYRQTNAQLRRHDDINRFSVWMAQDWRDW